MQNPWKELSLTSPFILQNDQRFIDEHALKASADFAIQSEMYPEPFLGSPNAEIIILNLNPGFGGEKDLLMHREHDYFIKSLRKNLTHENVEYPFIFLDPKLSDTPGYGWWAQKLKTLIGTFTPERLAKSLFCLEYFPYHSRKFNVRQHLPSQDYTFFLAREAIKSEKLIICFRSFSRWAKAIPELVQYKNVYSLNSPQNVCLTRNNCPVGYAKILELMNRK